MADNTTDNGYGFFRDNAGQDYKTTTGSAPTSPQTVYDNDGKSGTWSGGHVNWDKSSS